MARSDFGDVGVRIDGLRGERFCRGEIWLQDHADIAGSRLCSLSLARCGIHPRRRSDTAARGERLMI